MRLAKSGRLNPITEKTVTERSLVAEFSWRKRLEFSRKRPSNERDPPCWPLEITPNSRPYPPHPSVSPGDTLSPSPQSTSPQRSFLQTYLNSPFKNRLPPRLIFGPKPAYCTPYNKIRFEPGHLTTAVQYSSGNADVHTTASLFQPWLGAVAQGAACDVDCYRRHYWGRFVSGFG